MDLENLFEDFPEEFGDEEFMEELLDDGNVRIERIVSHGHSSPDEFWYDQDEDEWVVLLSGADALVFDDEDEEVVLRPGDHIRIPAHRKHRVSWTSPGEETVWLAVFSPAVPPPDSNNS
jgi:cupin 2 domain-containing protein